MSSELLCKAAETLRERAEDAGSGTMWFDADIDLRNALRGTFGCYDAGNADVAADARWIATMHPGVGLALADHLDAFAAFLDSVGPQFADRITPSETLTLARLIVGESR